MQDFLTESIELGETDYRDAKSAAEVERVLALAKKIWTSSWRLLWKSSSAEPAAQSEAENPEEAESDQLALGTARTAVGRACRSAITLPFPPKPGKALTVALDDSETAAPLKLALAEESLVKAVHDYKSAMHVFAQQGIALAGVQHDPLLYAYLLDPTYSTYGLHETAFRKFNLKLGAFVCRGRRRHAAPGGKTAR